MSVASVCEARGLGVVTWMTFMSCVGWGSVLWTELGQHSASETHRPCAMGDGGDSGLGHGVLSGRCLSRHRPGVCRLHREGHTQYALL